MLDGSNQYSMHQISSSTVKQFDNHFIVISKPNPSHLTILECCVLHGLFEFGVKSILLKAALL